MNDPDPAAAPGPGADSAAPPPAAAPAGRPLRLPPRRPLSSARLPKKREGPVLPQLEGKALKCPYCGADIRWPPEGLRCPACGRVLRPPPGFAPKDLPLRRAAKEKIAAARDKALREMGPRAGFGEAANRTGFLVAALFLLFLGAALVGASRRAAPERRPGRDPATWTTNALQTAAMALAHYRADTGHWPSLREGGLAALETNPGLADWFGPYLHGLGNDGWNRPWLYVPPPEDAPAAGAVAEDGDGAPPADGPFPDLRSAGEDRAWNTADDLVAAPAQFRLHPKFVRHDPSRLAPDAVHSVVIDPSWAE